MSYSTTAANALLDLTFRNTASINLSVTHAQLHNGNPGAEGTLNVVPNVARIPAVNWESSAYGWLRNEDNLTWTGMPDLGANNSITHVTLWNQASAGNCIHICRLERQDTEVPVVSETNNFMIPAYYLHIDWVGE